MLNCEKPEALPSAPEHKQAATFIPAAQRHLTSDKLVAGVMDCFAAVTIHLSLTILVLGSTSGFPLDGLQDTKNLRETTLEVLLEMRQRIRVLAFKCTTMLLELLSMSIRLAVIPWSTPPHHLRTRPSRRVRMHLLYDSLDLDAPVAVIRQASSDVSHE